MSLDSPTMSQAQYEEESVFLVEDSQSQQFGNDSNHDFTEDAQSPVRPVKSTRSTNQLERLSSQELIGLCTDRREQEEIGAAFATASEVAHSEGTTSSQQLMLLKSAITPPRRLSTEELEDLGTTRQEQNDLLEGFGVVDPEVTEESLFGVEFDEWAGAAFSRVFSPSPTAELAPSTPPRAAAGRLPIRC